MIRIITTVKKTDRVKIGKIVTTRPIPLRVTEFAFIIVYDWHLFTSYTLSWRELLFLIIVPDSRDSKIPNSSAFLVLKNLQGIIMYSLPTYTYFFREPCPRTCISENL
jgi:hypothetical protein